MLADQSGIVTICIYPYIKCISTSIILRVHVNVRAINNQGRAVTLNRHWRLAYLYAHDEIVYVILVPALYILYIILQHILGVRTYAHCRNRFGSVTLVHESCEESLRSSSNLKFASSKTQRTILHEWKLMGSKSRSPTTNLLSCLNQVLQVLKHIYWSMTIRQVYLVLELEYKVRCTAAHQLQYWSTVLLYNTVPFAMYE